MAAGAARSGRRRRLADPSADRHERWAFTRAVAREIGRELTDDEADALQRRHGEIFREILPERRPLPGAVGLLAPSSTAGVVHGIATSGRRPEIDLSLEALGFPASTVVVERGDVLREAGA